MNEIIKGDIHNVIKTIPDNSIDFIYTDPPFAITSAKWDKPLKWKELFPEMWRVLKPDGVIALYSSIPFTYTLLRESPEPPKYHFTWIKNNSTGFFQVKFQPLRETEEILIYYKKKGRYFPQMIGDKFYPKRLLKVGGGQGYYNERKRDKHFIDKQNGHIGNYPTNVIKFPIRKENNGITRTDEQIDFFIKSFTNEDDTVLDMTCHNNYVANRCLELSRNYIGVDLNPIV
mgnify:FL=1|tara:strand:- start:1184 stop:1873 length:690 start_codon:yes stop_codon:yes gene_type:complete